MVVVGKWIHEKVYSLLFISSLYITLYVWILGKFQELSKVVGCVINFFII